MKSNGKSSAIAVPLAPHTATHGRQARRIVPTRSFATPVRPGKGGIQVRVITSLEELQEVRPFWDYVNEHPDADAEFYSLIVNRRREVISPYVLVASEDDRPTAIFVGRLERSHIRFRAGYLTLARWRTLQFSMLQDGFLGDREFNTAEAIINRIVHDLKAGVAEQAVLYNVDVESDLRRIARHQPNLWCRDRSKEMAERWRTSLPGSLEEFLKRRSKKHRYWLKRISRVFEEKFRGRVQYRVLCKPENVPEVCELVEKVARKSYQRGLGVGFLNNIEDRWRVELAARRGWLRAYIVCLDEKPLAFWCGRFYKGIMYLDWTGYDPAYRKYELGTILFLKIVEDLCQLGASEMDYGSGGSFYKERFGDKRTVREVVSIYAPTVKSCLAGNLKSIESVANKVAKKAITQLRIDDRTQYVWRGRFQNEPSKQTGQGKNGYGKNEA